MNLRGAYHPAPRSLLLVAIALTFVEGCGDSSDTPPRAGFGGGFVGVGGGPGRPPPTKAGCPSFSDQDSDGIPDLTEGASDTDGDGIPSMRDPDSDADGISDRDEVNGQVVCGMQGDCDNDGAPDTQDTDSDNDSLSDAMEASVGLSTCSKDSDLDGCDDLADFELGGCDASRVSAKLCIYDSPNAPIVRLKILDAAERLEPRIEIVKLVNQFDLAWIEGTEPVEVDPAGAATIEAGGFSNVARDATVGVSVKFAVTPPQSMIKPWALIAVRAYAPSGTRFGEALLLVVVDNCERPIPI